MKNGKREYWLFNTDEVEPVGREKHSAMFKQRCIAAWGRCKNIGAEATLNRPDAEDVVFYFRAGFGIVACAVLTEELSTSSRSIFDAWGEYNRAVKDLQILPDDAPVTVAQIKEVSGYQIPVRQIVGRILNDRAVKYLLSRFKNVKKTKVAAKAKQKTNAAFRGGGFSTDQKIRRQVENAAVKFVRKLYESKKWTVKSMERDKVGYDLYCSCGDKIEKIEVKGTRGAQPAFIATANELERAKSDPDFYLYVVTNVLSTPKATRYTGNSLKKNFDFRAMQYMAKPKKRT